MVALALLALLGPALAGCGAEDVSPTDIAEAVDTTVAAGGVRIALRQTLTIPGTGRLATTGAGVLDARRPASHVTLKVTSGPDLVVGAFDQNDLVTEVITDGFTVYTHSPQLGQLLGAGRKWVNAGAAQIRQAAGVDVSALTQPGQDPAQAIRQLRAVSGDVETVGEEDVRGIATTRYRARVDLRRFPDLVSEPERAAAGDAIDELMGRSGQSTIPVDVWLDDEGRVRRLAQRLALKLRDGPSAVEQRFDFYDFGVKVRVEIPAARDVEDLTDLVDVRDATVGP